VAQVLQGVREVLLERPVEAVEHLDPVEVVFLDLVEFGLHLARVPNIHDLREGFDKFVCDDFAEIGE
jgi:hypothetical protein